MGTPCLHRIYNPQRIAGQTPCVESGAREKGVADIPLRRVSSLANVWRSGLIPNVLLDYSYIRKVHRIFGDRSTNGNFKSDTHLLNARYQGLDWGALTAYGYLVDLKPAAALSSQTYGLRWTGMFQPHFNHDVQFGYALEYAHQSDFGGSPRDYTAHYVLVEPSLRYRDLELRAGFELLDGDGTDAFQTPLATLHKFNGVTDKFLNTPGVGIEDYYVALKYELEAPGPLESASFQMAYHVFEGHDNGRRLGDEWSVKMGLQIHRKVSISIEHARYGARTFASDTDKTWLTAQVSF